MTTEQFSYWLQGFVELNGEKPTPEQWQSIKDHLKTVFHKVTPSISIPNSDKPIIDIDWNPQPTPFPFQPLKDDNNPNLVFC